MAAVVPVRRKLLKQWLVVLLLGGFTLMLLFGAHQRTLPRPVPTVFSANLTA